MTETAPKTCPFCGTEPLLQEFPAHEHVLATFMPDHEGSWAIECPGCGVGVCTDNKENALAIWNRRPNPETQAMAPVESVPVSVLRELEAEWLAECADKGIAQPIAAAIRKQCADRLSAVIRGTKT